jgi:hypothetical protein
MKKILLSSAFLFSFIILSFFISINGSENVDYSKKIKVCKIEGNGTSNGSDNYLLPCLESVFNKDSNDDLLARAKSYIELSKNNQGLGVYCHQILHYIGGSFSLEKYQSISENKDDFELVLPSCGYGFLHGFFENTPLSGNNNDEKLLKSICDPLSHLSNKNLKLECFHALGHAVSDSYKSADKSKEVCSKAYNDNTQALIGCFGGVSMKIRDQILVKINNGEKFPPTLTWFNEIGNSCQNADFLWRVSCAPGFVQLATDQGIEYVKPFLLWCDATLKPESTQCYQQAGVYMGHFKDKLGTAEEIVAVCIGASDESKNIDICINSIPEGRLNAGSSVEDSVRFLCKSKDEFNYCDDIYKKYLQI